MSVPALIPKLTPKERLFVQEYLIDMNAAAAARRAGYSEKSARAIGYENLTKPHVQLALQEAQAVRLERVSMSQADVIDRLAAVASADPGEVMELRRVCCRFCYGRDHLYQERPAERHARKRDHDHLLRTIPETKWRLIPPFDELGGVGYDSRKPAVEDCPQCEGEGELLPFVSDTRKLSKRGKAAFAGFKLTREGVEVKMHDQTKALELLGRHFGMFADRTIHQNPDGSAVEPVGALVFVGRAVKRED